MRRQSSQLLYGVRGAITTEKEGERVLMFLRTLYFLSVLQFSSRTFRFASPPSVLEPCSVRT